MSSEFCEHSQLRTVFCFSEHFLTPLWHRDLKVTARIEHPASFLPCFVFPKSCLKESHYCQTQIPYYWWNFCRSSCWRSAACEMNSGKCCSVLVVHPCCCFFLHGITHSHTHTHTKKKVNYCSGAKHISEEVLNLSLSRWNEKLCVQSQGHFSFHVTALGTGSPCWRIRVRVVIKAGSLWSLLGEQGRRRRRGWSHALGQQDKVLEVELCVPLLLHLSCKTSALALHLLVKL